MATQTILRNIGGVDDMRMALSNSNPRRALSIGSNWTKIRIGVRMCINGTASITGSPRFVMGVCSGTSNPWNNGSAITTHFVGASSSTASWNLSSGVYFVNTGSIDWRPTKRVGTAETFGSNISLLIVPAVSISKRWMYFLDITKGSPNFTLSGFSPNGTGAADASYADFLATVAVEVPSVGSYVFGTSRTLAVDETADGSLDSVCIAWNRTAPTIEVSDLAIVRFA